MKDFAALWFFIFFQILHFFVHTVLYCVHARVDIFHIIYVLYIIRSSSNAFKTIGLWHDIVLRPIAALSVTCYRGEFDLRSNFLYVLKTEYLVSENSMNLDLKRTFLYVLTPGNQIHVRQAQCRRGWGSLARCSSLYLTWRKQGSKTFQNHWLRTVKKYSVFENGMSLDLKHTLKIIQTPVNEIQ